jgi:multidrug efflux pump subunit AcrB
MCSPLIVFLGVTAIRVMPTDIFPGINIPVVTIAPEHLSPRGRT